MNKEKIVHKARQLYIIDYMMPIQLGVAMAEWMQEQCHKEYLEANAEIEKQHVQDIKDLQEQKQSEIAELINLVKARDGMIEQMAERIDELNDKISELTEALDASHVFCEGVKDAVVKKACELYCATCIKRHVCIKLHGYQHDKCIQYQTFEQTMKGGDND